MEQRDFFISYTSADEPWARWIANVLKSNGYTVYAQFSDIKPGDNFVRKMNAFLKSSENFIAVWSARYFHAPYCNDEIYSAYIQRNKGQMQKLFLVRIDSEPIEEPLFAGLVHIALSDRSATSEITLINAVFDAVPHSVKPQDTPLQEYPLLYQWGETSLWEDAETLYKRGEACLWREGDYPDYTKARWYYERAAEEGSADALFYLGFLYRHGLGVAQDYDKARQYYEQAEAQGNVAALYHLGVFYQCIKEDYPKALEYYQKAVDRGNTTVAYFVKQLRRKMRDN